MHQTVLHRLMEVKSLTQSHPTGEWRILVRLCLSSPEPSPDRYCLEGRQGGGKQEKLFPSPLSALTGADFGWEAVPSIQVKGVHSLRGEGEQVEGCEMLTKGHFRDLLPFDRGSAEGEGW